MIWFGLFIIIIGYIIYRADKKIKEKFESKFNPVDWDLPIGEGVLPTSGLVSAKASISLEAAARINLTYEKRESLFTSAEKLLFEALQSALGIEYQLFPKISVADAIKKSSANAASIPAHIATKQFNIIVCDKNNFSFLCAVEFNEKFQSQPTAPAVNDPVLVAICQSLQLPLVCINRQMKYDVEALRTEIITAINALEIKNKHSSKNTISDITEPTFCPKCSAEMKQHKTKMKGQEEKLLWVCTHYPECKGARHLSH